MSRRISRVALLGTLLVAVGATPALAEHGHGPHGLGRARIGIQVQTMTPELREHMGAPVDRGVLVVRVESGGPAARAGVEVGDVATLFNDSPIASPHDLIRAVARSGDGATVTLSVIRNAEERSLAIEPRPGEARAWGDAVDSWIGRFERGIEDGRGELRLRLDQLEKRLEELQQRMEERLGKVDAAPLS